MDLKIIAIYCICDDLIKSRNIQDDPQCQMKLAEVMTTGIVAALFYRANLELARQFLHFAHYIPNMLSRSRLNRRLLAIDPSLWYALFTLCKILLSAHHSADEFVVDSCPMPVCHPCRSWRCKLYQGKQYLGYCAAKKLHYYGLKIHLIVSSQGTIVEFLFTAASQADISALKEMAIDLPKGAFLYGDRAYLSQELEEELRGNGDIELVAQRRRKSKNQLSGPLAFLQKTRRKIVETVFSQITRYMGRCIVARSRLGFEIRVFLFVLAYSIEQLVTA
jgi:hypothetical protein